MLELKERFTSSSSEAYKACSLLNPERFSEVERDGVPEGGLTVLCSLANVDEKEASKELYSFAKNYYQLIETIQVEFRVEEHQSYDIDEEDSDEEEMTTDYLKNRYEKKACKKDCLRCKYNVLRKHGLYQVAYKKRCRVYKVALRLPCTQVSCERSFSKLKIIKNRLRNAISEELLRPCMLMAIERDIVQEIDVDEVIDEYASTSKE